MKKHSFGFTLIEVLIFIAIISVLIVILLAIINNFFKSYETSRRLDTLQDESSFIFNDLVQEVHWSNDFYPDAGPNKLVLTHNDETITYRLENNQILKNNSAISSDNVKITSFTVKNLANGEIPCFKISLSLKYNSSLPPKVTAKESMTVSFRKENIEGGQTE